MLQLPVLAYLTLFTGTPGSTGTPGAPVACPVPTSEAVAIGTILFDKSRWFRGSLPSLTFTVATGRGLPEKVAAYLYVSEEPHAYMTSPYRPQLAGVVYTPGELHVNLDLPDRLPLNEYTREKFVQGALFDFGTGDFLGVTNEEYLDIVYDQPSTPYVIDFEMDDDGMTPLANGQDISTPPEFGHLISIVTQQLPAARDDDHDDDDDDDDHHHSDHFGAAIFDTDPNGPNASSQDPDLLVGLGNALILQANPQQTVPGIFDHPNDSADGGTFVIEFTGFDVIEKVEPVSIDLIDMDGTGTAATILMIDVLGRTRTFTVPGGWTNDISFQSGPGYGTLDLTDLDPQPGFTASATATGNPNFLEGEVVRMEITLFGSGAIDNLHFQQEPDPDGTAESRDRGLGSRPLGPRR